MKNSRRFLLGASFLLLAVFASAQPKRYLDPVFTNVKRTNGVIYGSNFTVLTISTLGRTVREPLVMDVYEPEGDTLAQRPLVLYFHTGNFLPWINPQTGQSVNQSCGGTRNDPAAQEFCTRLARMGYVAASVDYRLGWRPDLLNELQRRFTLINAAYRAIQDARTCIRFFRKDAATGGNQFRIDPNRIVLFGQGTGGYISLNTAALDKYSEILNTSEPGKFIINNVPMVIEQYNGDPYGIQAAPGIVDAQYAALTGFPVGDTLYVPNHIGFSSDFKLAVNLGGALGDKAWLDNNTPPILSFHVPTDPFAPCGDGLVIVPGVNFPVVNVTGSCGIQPIMDSLKRNAVFSQGGLLTDPLSVYARTINGNREGFYPFLRPATQSAPWEWNRIIPPPLTTCNTDSVEARRVIDTIIAYYAPRACRALGLNCPGISVSTEEIFDPSLVLTVFPNPAQSEVWFSSDGDHPILSIEIFDINGRLVRQIRGIQASSYLMPRDGLPRGMYVAKLYFAQGIASRKLLFD
ncbi:MAG: T9SS type A sorting domain-containing protein [Saprospiraceae bacterium]|nr:T9SS type A sorting domain-containing protein [Saprospiraceae bacterium]MDW8484620.1 T9SS type A sorting domain-containing protein [Saprospiraceae bacterium]